MRRGDIVWTDFEPVRGHESDKRRPAVLVSNDGVNRTVEALGRGVVTVVPVTGNIERVYPFQVLLPGDRCGLGRTAKAQAEQVRSVAAERLAGVAGRVPGDLLAEIDDALRLHLGL